MKTLLSFALALFLCHHSASAQLECPTELVVTPISYTCNQAAQTYDVVFTIRSLEPTIDPWVGSFVTADLGTLTLGCESAETGGNPDCFYDYPPVWNWICACDGRSYEKDGYTDFVGCTGLTIVSNNFCDGTYPVSYQLTDIPLGLDVGLTVTVNMAISLPDVFFSCPFFLTLPAPPSPIQPGNISGGTTVCEGASTMFNVSNIPGATGFQWTAPNGSSIVSGQGTNTVQVQWGSVSGNICVASTTNCGISATTCLAVTVAPHIALSGIASNGLTGSFTLTGGLPQANGSNYASVTMTLQGNPGVTAMLTGAPFTHNEVAGFTAPQAGTYTVVATDAHGCTGAGTVVVSGGGGGMMGVAPCIEWQRCLGGSYFESGFTSSIETTIDGGIVIAGSAASTDGDLTGNYGEYDFWVVKLDPSGSIIWQKNYGGSLDDEARDIQPTPDGGLIVVGSTKSADGDVTGYHGSEDIWVIKLDGSGNLLWQKALGGDYYQRGYSVQNTLDGGFIIAGESGGNDGDVSVYYGGLDIWLVKLNGNGEILWEKTLGGSQYEYVSSIEVTSDGGFILAGTSESNDYDVSGGHGDLDFWVVKLDDTGSIVWQKMLGGSKVDWLSAAKVNPDGSIFITGITYSDDGDLSGNNVPWYALWVVKLSSTGGILWEKIFSLNEVPIGNVNLWCACGYREFTSIQSTQDGGYIVTGDGGSQGQEDFLIFKLGSAGELSWQKTIGGTMQEGVTSINVTADGGLIVAGKSDSNDGDVSGNHGAPDIWVVKLQTLALPTCPPLLSPTPNATNVPTTTSLSWNTVTGCLDGYHLSLGTTPGGADLLNNQTVTDTFYQPAPALPAGATIYVRIVPFNSLGDASGCQEFSFMTAGTTSTGCDVVRDSLALVALYDATGGNNWFNKLNWKIPGKPISSWHGILATSEGCVGAMILSDNLLDGQIPESFGNLTMLESVDLQNNNLTNALPTTLGNLVNLEAFYIRNNPNITGPFPPGFTNCTKLKMLSLALTGVTGSLPPNMNNMQKLRYLILDDTPMSGQIPTELTLIPDLISIYLNNSNFSGTLPDFSNSPNLMILSFPNNHISRIPLNTVPAAAAVNSGHGSTFYTQSGFAFSIGLPSGLYLQENALTFQDILPLVTPFFVDTLNLPYSPQDSIFSDTLFIRNPGQSLTIDLGIDANVSGNQYQWFKNGAQDGAALNSNKRTFSSLTPLNAGTYHVQVTNTAAPALTLYSREIRIQVACTGVPIPAISGPGTLCGASAILSVSGNYPNPPQWSTGQSGASITINAPGSYSVTVTDVGGCTNSNTLVVGSAPAPNPPLVNGISALCSGTTILSVSGNYATPPQWSTGQSGNTITISSAGTYTVTVTDIGGCTNSNTKIVAATGAAFTPAISGPTALCPGAVASLVVAGNYPNLPQWSTGQAGYTTQVGPGNYTVTVTDSGGCTYTNVHQISPKPDIFVQKDTVICAGQSIVFCGVSVSQPDTVECTYTTSTGCDSIVTLRVSRFDPTQFSANTDIVAFSVQTSVHDFDVTANDTYTNGYVLKILQWPTQGDAQALNNNELRYTRDTATALGLDSLQYGLCAPGNCPNTCVSAWVYLQAQSGTVDDIKALIPNVVTPNDDGVNDVFDPVKILADNGIITEKAELFIINRWGEVIHHNHDGRWEGKAPQATYYYRLRIVVAGTEYHLQGTVNLLK